MIVARRGAHRVDAVQHAAGDEEPAERADAVSQSSEVSERLASITRADRSRSSRSWPTSRRKPPGSSEDPGQSAMMLVAGSPGR